MKPITILAAAAILLVLAGECHADKIHFKDGTVKEVEIYEESPTYICFVHKGKLAGASRSTIERIEYEDEPLFDVKKILAQKKAERQRETDAASKKELSVLDLLRAEAEGARGNASAEEKKKADRIKLLERAFNPAGAPSGAAGSSGTTPKPAPKPAPGVTVVPASKSETGESEIIVDPFPGSRR